ncbi:MAG TPA: heme peroxidase family protein [Bradyrhizobium sp.]|nr:heme peroxidase family protein [Bradyrhizobium sp.]
MDQTTDQHFPSETPAPVPAPASRYPEGLRALFSVFAYHGRPLRGLMSTSKSPNFQGRFGRMFRSLPAGSYGKTDQESRQALMSLGAAMTSRFEPPKDGFDGEESGIPALYTYFGQFIDHDITFDPMTTLIQHSDPDALTDFRTPALDLDNVYGRGPGDQPYLYESDGLRFVLGEQLDNGALDLPRNNATPRRALIGDPRNDENSIVSQFQALMLRFHNRIADENKSLDLPSLQKIVRWHYQWVITHDFLPRIISAHVLDELKSGGRYDQSKLKFYHWKNEPFMPVEFSVAAYRLGHSMIRPGYRLNDNDATLLPIFPIPETVPGAPKGGISPGLAGFEAMAKNRGIDWGRFIDIGEARAYGGDPDEIDPPTADMKKRLQFAYRIDTSVVTPLSVLPYIVASDPPPSLAQRNLLRGFEVGLPTGQNVAKAMGLSPLKDEHIVIGKAVDKPADDDVLGSIADLKQFSMFRGNCPLWTYILAEAARTRAPVNIPVTPATTIQTPQLGDVGGRIVAEVFLGMLFGDNDSYLSADPEWTPNLAREGQFALRDLVTYALGQ